MSPSRCAFARCDRSSACWRCRSDRGGPGRAAWPEMVQARGMTWKTLLVPHDFSASANHATAIARDEARLHGGTLVLLHVIELPPQLGPDAVIVPPETGTPISIQQYALQSAEAHLQDIADRLARDGVTARCSVV